MTYKEFEKWCGDRACDGCWGIETARICIVVMREVRKKPFWKRERFWQTINISMDIEDRYVIPTNKKIEEVMNGPVTFPFKPKIKHEYEERWV